MSGVLARSAALRLAWQRVALQKRCLSAGGSNTGSSGSSSSSNSEKGKSSDTQHSTNSQGNAPGRIRDRHAVDAAAARRAHQHAVAQAQWATSWMMPWERAQLDGRARPLKLWERVYWRLFAVLGSVGFAYETWVLGNRRMWVCDGHGGAEEGIRERERERVWTRTERPHVAVVRQAEGWYRGRDVQSGRLLTDEELVEAAKRGARWA